MQLLRHGASLLLVTALLAACGAPAPSAAPSAPTASQVPATATEPSPTETAAPTPAGSPTPQPIADDPPPVALEVVADGLADPIGIASAPGGWLLVNERAGRVVAIRGGERSIALDITDRVLGEDERGLLGLVLHPDWPDDPRAFVHYSDRERRHGAVGVPGTQDGEPRPCSTPPASGCSSRGPALREPQRRAARLRAGRLPVVRARRRRLRGRPARQRPESVALLGSILRLDVSAPGGYAVPPDNPFADGAGGAPEIYLFGLRNPWRFSFDPETGVLWIADVGQNAYEEIDLSTRRQLPAPTRLEPDGGIALLRRPACSPEGSSRPLAEYGHDLGCSVTGGHVYRGGRSRAARLVPVRRLLQRAPVRHPLRCRAPADGSAPPRACCSRRGARSAASAPTRTASSTSPTSSGGALLRIVAGG